MSRVTVLPRVVCAVGAIVAVVLASWPDRLRSTEAGLLLIGDAEGCIATPYYCPAGVLTVGIGSTGNIDAQHRYSGEAIARRWVDDIQTAEDCVNGRFNGKAMPQPVFEAVTSAAFNLGCTGLRLNKTTRRPTQMALAAQRADWATVCDRLTDFTYSGGVQLPGLVARRHAEQQHCRGEG